MLRKKDLALILLNRYQGMTLGTPAKAERVIEAIFETIEKALINGEEVRIQEFGTFKTVMFSKRKNGGGCVSNEPFHLPERRMVRFAVSEILRNKVQGKDQ